jgi:flagellar assembly factor FliW
MINTPLMRRFLSSRFGEVEIPENLVIHVPDGIIGFPGYSDFALLDPSGGQSMFLWLQSVDKPELAFIVANPIEIAADYTIDLSEPDLIRLGVAEKNPPALFVIVSVPPDNPENVNANLIAPLLYFDSDKTLFQIVLEKKAWPIRYFLFAQENSEDATPISETHKSGEVQ